MISIYHTTKQNLGVNDNYITTELRGLSTDEKPTELNDKKIANGSTFIEMDTLKIYFYDAENEEWITNESGE